MAVVRAAGHDVGKVVVARGKTRLDPKIPKYNLAARYQPWVVFRDSDSICPVTLRTTLLTGVQPFSPRFRLRIAHSMIEAWLLADIDGFATFFEVSRARLPPEPESLQHAKNELVQLCTASRSRPVRRDMVAANGAQGMLYVTRINEYASSVWNVRAAASRSPSLSRALAAIESLER